MLSFRIHPSGISVLGDFRSFTMERYYTHVYILSRLSPMQKLVVEQDAQRWVPLQPTHFFHLDNNEGRAGQFSRECDFIGYFVLQITSSPQQQRTLPHLKKLC